MKRDPPDRVDAVIGNPQIFHGEQRGQGRAAQIILHGVPSSGSGASCPRPSVFAQVSLQYLRVALDFLGGALRDGLAEIQDGEALAEIHHHPHLVFDQQDGQGEVVLQLADSPDQVLGFRLVHARGGLIQQKQLGPADQGPGHFDPPLLPVRQVLGRGVGIMGEVKPLQQFKGLAGHLLLGRSETPAAPQGVQQGIAMLGEGAQADVVQDAQLFEQADILKGPGNPGGGDAVAAPVADIFAPEENPALTDTKNPGDEIEHGGLARAVGPDEPHQLPGENLQGKIGQGLEAAETVGKVDDGQEVAA